MNIEMTQLSLSMSRLGEVKWDVPLVIYIWCGIFLGFTGRNCDRHWGVVVSLQTPSINRKLQTFIGLLCYCTEPNTFARIIMRGKTVHSLLIHSAPSPIPTCLSEFRYYCGLLHVLYSGLHPHFCRHFSFISIMTWHFTVLVT